MEKRPCDGFCRLYVIRSRDGGVFEMRRMSLKRRNGIAVSWVYLEALSLTGHVSISYATSSQISMLSPRVPARPSLYSVGNEMRRDSVLFSFPLFMLGTSTLLDSRCEFKD